MRRCRRSRRSCTAVFRSDEVRRRCVWPLRVDPSTEPRTYHWILRRPVCTAAHMWNKKTVLLQRWPRDAPTKVNRQPHLHLRSHDSRLTQFNRVLWNGRRCWTNIFSPKFLHVPLGVGGWPLGYEKRRCWANCSHNSFRRFSTYVVMIHQVHRRTDRRHTITRLRFDYTASRGKNVW